MHKHLTTACILLGLVACGSTYAAPPASITVPVSIVRAIDGDTLDCDVTIRVRVRLLAGDKGGCWAPEKNTPEGKRAAESLSLATAGLEGNLLTGTLQIPLHTGNLQDVFTFGRVLGNVWVGEQKTSLGEQQIEKGLASSAKGKPLGQ